MLTESQDEYYHRMMRPGELNEVQEEDNEDYSDNLSYNSPERTGLPTTTHGREESAELYDASTPDFQCQDRHDSEAADQHFRNDSDAI